MSKVKSQKSKVKTTIKNSKFLILSFGFAFLVFTFTFSFAQPGDDLEFTIDLASKTTPLSKVFRPSVDLSGRGFHRHPTWPQNVASKETLDAWSKDIGFNQIYRMQYNLWEIAQLNKNRILQHRLMSNYEAIISQVNSAGGIVVLDIFGTPAGFGRVLDKKSAPFDWRAFKQLVKSHIRYLSCNKKYNIWYEVWSAPDLDDFFLGKRQEYLNLYRGVAEAIRELEKEYKIDIPVGGPGVSWWFQNVDGNTVLSPEHSLIYELIKFCYRYHLPLDFITWHGYSSDPSAERESTVYKKTSIALMRDWLSYFKFKRDIPLIVSEWNYDRGANVSPARKEKSFIASSYIPARMKNMQKAGIDYQFYFSLEDFQANKEGVVRNTGIFWFDPEYSDYKGGAKTIYNVFRMLNYMGENSLPVSPESGDEFAGVVATRAKDYVAILLYNYIDPDIAVDYLSRNIATLPGGLKYVLLNLVKSDKLSRITSGQDQINGLRLHSRVKALLRQAKELNDKALNFQSRDRTLNISIKNLKENYLYQRYAVDSSCGIDCKFAPVEEKDIAKTDFYKEALSLAPYSVHLIILRPKPKEPEAVKTGPAPGPEIPIPAQEGPAQAPGPQQAATDADKKQ